MFYGMDFQCFKTEEEKGNFCNTLKNVSKPESFWTQESSKEYASS